MMRKAILFVAAVCILCACGGERTRRVQVQTSFGNMTFDLYNTTPKHRDNFVKLAGEGYYDDLLFHRIISGFMIQGGDPDSKGAAPGQRLGMGGPGYLVDAEIGAPHFKGTLAAARTGGPQNPDKKSSGSQFYVVHGRKYPQQEIERIAQSKGIQYSPEQIQKYADLGGAPSLDMEYTVFGEMTEGYEIIDRIAAVQKNSDDRPLRDIKMKVILLN